MAEIVDFPVKSAPVDITDGEHAAQWVCGCGNSTFKLLSDATIACANCRAPAREEGRWIADFPERPATPDVSVNGKDDVSDQVIDMNDPDRAVQRLLTRAGESKLAALIAVHNDGGLQFWGASAIETPEQVSWLRRKLDAVVAMCQVKEIG